MKDDSEDASIPVVTVGSGAWFKMMLGRETVIPQRRWSINWYINTTPEAVDRMPNLSGEIGILKDITFNMRHDFPR